MTSIVWQQIKNSKGFYVRTYRKLSTIMLGSVILNLILLFGIVYVYSEMPEPDFYSTYGEVPPVKLTAMDMPNYGPTALLEDVKQYDSAKRRIPN